jgi:hypothetical protein
MLAGMLGGNGVASTTIMCLTVAQTEGKCLSPHALDPDHNLSGGLHLHEQWSTIHDP